MAGVVPTGVGREGPGSRLGWGPGIDLCRRSARALFGSYRAVVGAALLGAVVLGVVVEVAFRLAWSDAGFVTVHDIWLLDDLAHSSPETIRDAAWARVTSGAGRYRDSAGRSLGAVIVLWLVVTALAQAWVATAVGRRAGDEVPLHSNLEHALRRLGRVLAGWSVVAAVLALLWLVGAEAAGWRPVWVAIPAVLVVWGVMAVVIARTSFFVAVAVAEDDLRSGLGWLDCLAVSWRAVHGDSIRSLARIAVVAVPAILCTVVPLQLFVPGLVHPDGIPLVVTVELVSALLVVTCWVGAAAGLWVHSRPR